MAKRKRGDQTNEGKGAKKKRVRQDTAKLRATAPLAKVTALQYTIHYLRLCAAGPADLIQKPGPGFIVRIIVTLWAIGRQFPKQEALMDEAAGYLRRVASDPCDFSDEAEHVEALVNELVKIKPGPE